jgi:hypothetical protein
VPVREEAARALAAIEGPRAAPMLERALTREHEAAVEGTIIAELGRLGALRGAVDGPRGKLKAPAGELWVVVPSGGAGSLTLVAPAEARAQADIRPGVQAYRFRVPKGNVDVEVQGPVERMYGR